MGTCYSFRMARPLRIEFPGALYHVMSRGIERGRIVRDDVDRHKRLAWLRRTVETYGGRLLGSERFVQRIGRLLGDRAVDSALPQLERVRQRPSLEVIVATVSQHFGHDASHWKPGKRNDDASRAVAAYLARRRFHYSAREVADALGYRSHGGVRNALARIDNADRRLRRSVEVLYQDLH